MEAFEVTAVYAVEAGAWEHVYRFALVQRCEVRRGRGRFGLWRDGVRVGRGTVSGQPAHGYRVRFAASLVGGAL